MNELPPDLNLLLALDVLLVERHITRAARRLGVTQSAASQRLARLREFFRDPLLVHGRPRASLTPRAEAIAAALPRALSELRAATRAGAPFEARSSQRRFVILGNDLVEALGLPPMLSVFAREAPRVTVHIDRADADFVDRLEKGTADLAFVPSFLAPSSLRVAPMPPERFVVLLRRGHPIRRLTMGRYLAADHLLIAPRGAPGSVVESALEKLGERRRVAARIQHFASAPFLLERSDLLLTCPEPLARLAADRFALRKATPPLDLPIDETCFVWHARSHDDPGHQWLRRRIAAHVARQREAAVRARA